MLESQERLRLDRKDKKHRGKDRYAIHGILEKTIKHTIFHASHLPGSHTFSGIFILWHIQSFWNITMSRKKEEGEWAEKGRNKSLLLINIKL